MDLLAIYKIGYVAAFFIIAFRWRMIRGGAYMNQPSTILQIIVGSLFWPYMVWGGVCSLTIDILSFIIDALSKLGAGSDK